MARTLISQARTGTSTTPGTDWPICDRLEREKLPGRRPEWIITRGLCNGIADSAVSYRKLRLAVQEWSRLGHSTVGCYRPRRTLCQSCHGSGKISRHVCGCERQIRCESCSGSGYAP